MRTKIGINGFGRTGRVTFKAINQRHSDKGEVVAINGRRIAETYAHLLKWDSTYGPFPGKVEANGDSIIVDGKEVRVFSENTPGSIPWKDCGVDMVI